jgi:hypothetical protein
MSIERIGTNIDDNPICRQSSSSGRKVALFKVNVKQAESHNNNNNNNNNNNYH